MLNYYKSHDLRVIRGQIINPLSDRICDFFPDGAIVARLNQNSWKIKQIGDIAKICSDYSWEISDIPITSGIILPPFYDSHFHWVQDDVREMPKTSLLEWLQRYTFPEEARYADPTFAAEKAERFWSRIVSTGTIGGLCYSSIHPCALDAAMKYAPKGFRIGNTLMNMNCPDTLTQTPDESIRTATYGAETYGSRYCITPRFAPTTVPEVMQAGARIAKQHDLFQQTHLGETQAEINWVLGMYRALEGFQDVKSYTEIYQRCGMLGPKTVMGHSIHLDSSEWQMLAETETAIASCPTSNAPIDDLGLGSGLFDFERAEAIKTPSTSTLESEGVRWALASDIGGGPFLSMFDVMHSFVHQNKDNGGRTATYEKALYRSTQAGADLLGIGQTNGNFAPEKAFDFIVIDAPILDNDAFTAEHVLQKIPSLVASREAFDSIVRNTVIDGETVFARDARSPERNFH